MLVVVRVIIVYTYKAKTSKVKAIDISEGAVEVSKLRGVKNVVLKNILDETENFDTIILLMNGTGIFQELSQVSIIFKTFKITFKC